MSFRIDVGAGAAAWPLHPRPRAPDGIIRYYEALHHCGCGDGFGEYIKNAFVDRPFPNFCHGATRTFTDLWAGRGLRILTRRPAGDDGSGGEWRHGRVVRWDEQVVLDARRNGGSPVVADEPCTLWSLTLHLDDNDDDALLAAGDMVEIHSLQSATQHNGKKAEIVEFVKDQQRYHVRYYGNNDGKKRVNISVKASNLRRILELTCKVHRMNVDNGGVLAHAFSQDKHAPLVSLEWTEEAWPSMDIITERADAWESTMLLPSLLDEPYFVDSADLDRRRASSDVEFNRMEVWGEGNNVDSENNAELRRRQNSFLIWKNKKIYKLIEDAKDDDVDGLRRFREGLMVLSFNLWMNTEDRELLDRHLPLKALLIRLQVFEERKSCIEGWMIFFFRVMGLPAGCTDLHDALRKHPVEEEYKARKIDLMIAIAEKYGAEGRHRAAILWFQRSLLLYPPSGQEQTVGNTILNRGKHEFFSDQFDAAQNSIDAGTAAGGSRDAATAAGKVLHSEMKEWIGASGHLPTRNY